MPTVFSNDQVTQSTHHTVTIFMAINFGAFVFNGETISHTFSFPTQCLGRYHNFKRVKGMKRTTTRLMLAFTIRFIPCWFTLGEDSALTFDLRIQYWKTPPENLRLGLASPIFICQPFVFNILKYQLDCTGCSTNTLTYFQIISLFGL